jgi:hypothetical protein
MPPKYAKGGRVKVLATRFDEGSADRNGDLFSVVFQRNGNGEHCFGNIAHVYSLNSKPVQSHRIKYDDGESHCSAEAHVLPGVVEDNAAEDSDEPADVDVANDDADGNIDATVTDSENDENPHNLDGEDLNTVAIGDVVEVGGRTWKRVEDTNEDCSKWLKDNPPSMRMRHRTANDLTREGRSADPDWVFWARCWAATQPNSTPKKLRKPQLGLRTTPKSASSACPRHGDAF